MPVKGGKAEQPPIVVDLESSDDDYDVSRGEGRSRNLPATNELATHTRNASNATIATLPTTSGGQLPDSRSFWQAGNYEMGHSNFRPMNGELEHARVHPKFLHTNATSHKWAFGAIAEILDNAVDEICNGATFVKIDRTYSPRDHSPTLVFHDDGGGMDPEGLRKCMSLGYSSKTTDKTIGQYGNGFKTSTIRLGADVVVFTRATMSGQTTQSVGLLSYNFLRKTGQDDIIVPMIDFDISHHWAEPKLYSSYDDWSANLKTILEWSPFQSKDEIMQQFEDIGNHGTKVIIYNLWHNDEGIYELNFDDDDEDVKLRDEANRGMPKLKKKEAQLQSNISYCIRFSLRAYISILYLKKFTNFQIILRGKPVEQVNLADELRYSKVVTYRPQLGTTMKEVMVVTTVGFIKEAPSIPVSGFNVYNKNRLIKPFWQVLTSCGSEGNGVIGILEANFIHPAHDKQDFERSTAVIRLQTKLRQIQSEYWKNYCHLVGFQPVKSTIRKALKSSEAQSPQGHISSTTERNIQNGQLAAFPPNALGMLDGNSVVDLEATPRKNLGSVQTVSKYDRSHDVYQSGGNASVHDVYQSGGNASESNQGVASVNKSSSKSIDQLCKENIQLFQRCEIHREKEKELTALVEEYEKKLVETRRKSAQLSAYLLSRKKQVKVCD
ncbi:protein MICRORCHIDIA 2-like isoform X2 [Impatiens glandulifera]|uniref:protein MICRORCHIDIA 2-like isoform X2 n=1 Tax=Impatiens glandulifera TaxID=253017 RepID=UPI001FB04FFF|nr:protein MICRORCHIDIA 2-like isoform X2 [Impatiens glandulifera]